MSRLGAITDAVIVAIDGAGLLFRGNPVVATKRYAPLFNLADITALELTAIPSGFESERIARNKSQRTYQVTLLAQAPIDHTAAGWIDATKIEDGIELLENLATELEKLATAAAATFIKIEAAELPEAYDATAALEQGIYTGGLAAIFQELITI